MRVSGPLLAKSAAWRSMLRMHPEADLGRDAGALDQLAEASNGERRAPLGNKNEGRLDVTFQSPQYPRLTQAFLVTNLK